MNPLGGPGVACSAMRVRRLLAGELSGEERARTEAHVAGCRRCHETQLEIERERVRLSADLPFETFAAGVAERLAPVAKRRRPLRRAGLALAAGVALAAAIPAVLQVAEAPSSTRRKGAGAELTVYLGDADGARALLAGEAVPARAALRIGLAPGSRRYAAVVLVDGDGATVLHAGAAVAGVLPGAFEWIGAGDGALVAVLDDVPVDPAALTDRIARGGLAAASPGGSAEVLLRPLRRAPP